MFHPQNSCNKIQWFAPEIPVLGGQRQADPWAPWAAILVFLMIGRPARECVSCLKKERSGDTRCCLLTCTCTHMIHVHLYTCAALHLWSQHWGRGAEELRV